ncbi:hypothetical protein [Arthrobacter sp. ISL-30]|uniref:hypothetical protein n=1 Tax=Arthrobacter sp. ISL-30 TaxID=2819109 RepID=UPI001BE5ECED|nr:hypothetical protein [Arthrobacter sp. ISL-30]MBT2515316.1 hypothetical protein [Arthrobacter sp. ISL-30]
MRAPQRNTPFQALRSAALATAIVSLAGGAHVLGGGTLPAPPILLAVVALTALGTTLATRIKLGLPAMATLLGGGQLLLHEAFTALGQAVPPAAGTTGHHSYSSRVVMAADVGASAHAHAPVTIADAAMLAGHILATLLAAVVLAKGEQSLWQLAAWLRPLVQLPHVVRVLPDAGTCVAPFGAPSGFIPRPGRNLRQDSRRGPPAAVVISDSVLF